MGLFNGLYKTYLYLLSLTPVNASPKSASRSWMKGRLGTESRTREAKEMVTDFSSTTDMIVALLPVIVMFMLIGVIVGALGKMKF